MSTQDGKSSKTMQRILDAAEILFIEYGFEATSLRAITQQADVNLAAVNYHFGSKEELIKSVFTRRFIPYLDDCEKELKALSSQPKPYQIEQLVQIILRPAVTLASAPNQQGLTLTRLISRMIVDNQQMVRETCSQRIEHIFQQLIHIACEILPNVDPETIAWRIHFAYNLLFHAFSGNDILTRLNPSAIGAARDPERIAKELSQFISGGLSIK